MVAVPNPQDLLELKQNPYSSRHGVFLPAGRFTYNLKRCLVPDRSVPHCCLSYVDGTRPEVAMFLQSPYLD